MSTESADGHYADGQVIDYTSFDPAGYSAGQVVRYAGESEQDNPADLLVYIRARSGGRPFPVRESQLRARQPGPASGPGGAAAGPDDYPREKLGLLACSAGELWDSTGGQDPYDVLSALQREALDLAAAVHRAELDRYPPQKAGLLVRSAGELWDSTGGQDRYRVLAALQREALDLAADLYRAELSRNMGDGEDQP